MHAIWMGEVQQYPLLCEGPSRPWVLVPLTYLTVDLVVDLLTGGSRHVPSCRQLLVDLSSTSPSPRPGRCRALWLCPPAPSAGHPHHLD